MSAEVKLACEGVWKLFGPEPERCLSAHQRRPSQAQLAAAGLIGAVQDVSLAIEAGAIFVIMGLSGSGKSTLVRCMSRLIEPTAGRILFEGQDLLQASERQLIEIRRHKMGMVFQHFALLPHLTVLGNVAFPLEIQGQSRAMRDARAREMIELVGLKGREHYYPRELSGGQQQRVGIARSLAVEPEIWFLDEPFSALDPLIRREMQDEFLRLQSVLKKTIAFITHDFDEAIRLADRIAIMQDGRVIQIGTPEELVTRPATAYVAEFTREIPRAKVLSARAVMSPAAGDLDGCAGTVAAEARIEAIARQVIDAGRPFAVTDDAGRVIGRIDPAAVLGVLVGDQSAAAHG
jgi:glycine betaine/proline transport system ATP-binding protein